MAHPQSALHSAGGPKSDPWPAFHMRFVAFLGWGGVSHSGQGGFVWVCTALTITNALATGLADVEGDPVAQYLGFCD
jgi:hypothetical protein